MRRVAFAGASGTGKTTLARLVAEEFGLPLNPVGSRSVAASMGFANPYDVDAAGLRSAFQGRLLSDKREWEARHDAFVTDRTTADNLAYLALHDVGAVDEAVLLAVEESVLRYDVVFYCPVGTFWRPDGDPARVQDLAYQRVYDALLYGLLRRFVPSGRLVVFGSRDPDLRKRAVLSLLALGRHGDHHPLCGGAHEDGEPCTGLAPGGGA